MERYRRFATLSMATAQISILETEIVVQFQKRAYNPLLLATGLHKRISRSLAGTKTPAPPLRLTHGVKSKN